MMIANAGIVVDINRFSIHDGPGIRTTVFLKGCPLNCKWCHNPEAINHQPQLSFNQEKCANCFECVNICPTGTHQIVSNKHHVEFSTCELSGTCITVCPNEALSIIGNTKTVEEIMSVLLQDKDFYTNSGGGVTISGGEPMTQFEFTKAILKACKEHSIHTTLDTCGHVPAERYLEILPYVDLFLYDYKETDSEKHKYYTGVYNNLIMKNLDTLYRANAKIILRCPIVPGFNDTESHFEGIRNLHHKYPNLVGIEIMPYHNIGLDKARKIGIDSLFINLKTTDKIISQQWVGSLKSLGCENVKVG